MEFGPIWGWGNTPWMNTELHYSVIYHPSFFFLLSCCKKMMSFYYLNSTIVILYVCAYALSALWKRSSFQDVHKPAVIPTMQHIRYCKGATYSRYIKAYITFELKILLILLPMVCSKDSACVPVCMCVATLGLIAHCKCGCVRLMHNCISNSMRL